MAIKLTVAEYQEHVDQYDGLCLTCEEWTREGETEPDAEEYECPYCGEASCIGAETALISGEIVIVKHRR